MTIHFPERKYLSFPELQSRWKADPNDIRAAVVSGALKASMHFDAELTWMHWVPHKWEVGTLTPAPQLRKDGGEVFAEMRGWFYLQEPSDTGPFACTFQLVSEGSHPVKDDSDPWPSDWYRLEQSVTLEQVEEKGVVMLTEVARFESHHDKPSSPGEAGHHLGTRERETLLKLVLGMAIEGYRFDPRAARNEAPAEIASDLAKHGMQLSDDTVRKWLKEAANSVLPGRPPNI